MSDLFKAIKDSSPLIQHGWCDLHKAETLAAMILALRPKTVLEVGVWGGKSFIPMALAIKELGTGVVIGIDPWSAEASKEGQINPEDQKFWSNQANHDIVYADFMRLIETFGLSQCTRIIRKKSDEVDPPEEIGVFHLDGNHGEQAVRDVLRFAPKCLTGSLCVMDDLGWTGGGPARAVAKLNTMGWRRLYNLGTGAVFQRA